jgi:SAM-dependent methyltransferase
MAATELFDPARASDGTPGPNGYVDLLGEDDPTGEHPGQRLMVNRVLPLIYERLWRPLGARLFMGAMGPGMRGEHEIALEMLALKRTDRVLDVACGPGNFTRAFARAAPEGVVVGLDASKPMLDRAVVEDNPANVSYVRGDAHALPFKDSSFDAVCCFAALYFISDPLTAVDEIVRVLAPGGRVALMTSVNRGVLPTPVANTLIRGATGVRIFGRDELTGALRERGLTVGELRVAGLAQFVSARSPRERGGPRHSGASAPGDASAGV